MRQTRCRRATGRRVAAATSNFRFEELLDQITAEDYAALPEEFCKTIEAVDGHLVKCESPSRVHNRVALNLA